MTVRAPDLDLVIKIPVQERAESVLEWHVRIGSAWSLLSGSLLASIASLSLTGSIEPGEASCKQISLALRGPTELGNHTLPVGLYELLLIAPDVVDVDLVESEVYVVLDMLQMLVKIGGYQNPVPKVIYVDQLRHSREVLGIADVGLGERHPAVGPLPYGLLLGLLPTVGVGDVELNYSRHGARVLVLLPRSLLEPLYEHLYLLVRGSDSDDPVTEPSRALAHYGSGGCDVYGRRRLRHRVQLRALEPYVLTGVLHNLAGEQPADDLYRLHEYAQPRRRLGPVAADYVLVERLTGPEAQPETPRVHRLQSGGGLGDDRRVVAESRWGYAGTEAQV